MNEFNIRDNPRDDNQEDEVINIRLPRAQYEILRKIIKREEALSWVGRTIRFSWVWIAGGGILSIFLLWDKIAAIVAKG